MRANRPSVPKTLLVLLMTIPFIYPFVYLVGTALKPVREFQNDKVGLPDDPTFANIEAAWSNTGLGDAMLHSVVAVSVGVAATVAISTAGAYWFLLNTGRLSKLLRVLLIGTMALPPPVFIIPLFLMLDPWGLTNNLVVLGLVYAAWNAAFGLYFMYAHYERIPDEILEAARVDGAPTLQRFVRIVLPLSRPAIATVAVLAFLWSWSDLLLSVVLVQDPGQRTATVATALLADRYSTNIPETTAGVLIALLPLLVIFLAGQRFLARGITAGVGK